MTSLLHRHLRNAGQGFAFLLEGCRITNDEDLRMSRNREVTLNAHATGAIRLDLQPFSCRRRCNARRPDHGLAGDALTGNHHTIFINLVDAVSEADLDT